MQKSFSNDDNMSEERLLAAQKLSEVFVTGVLSKTKSKITIASKDPKKNPYDVKLMKLMTKQPLLNKDEDKGPQPTPEPVTPEVIRDKKKVPLKRKAEDDIPVTPKTRDEKKVLVTPQTGNNLSATPAFPVTPPVEEEIIELMSSEDDISQPKPKPEGRQTIQTMTAIASEVKEELKVPPLKLVAYKRSRRSQPFAAHPSSLGNYAS